MAWSRSRKRAARTASRSRISALQRLPSRPKAAVRCGHASQRGVGRREPSILDRAAGRSSRCGAASSGIAAVRHRGDHEQRKSTYEWRAARERATLQAGTASRPVVPRTATRPTCSVELVARRDVAAAPTASPDAFTMLVFYRGLHCPVCQGPAARARPAPRRARATAVSRSLAVSGDTRERAEQADPRVGARAPPRRLRPGPRRHAPLGPVRLRAPSPTTSPSASASRASS